MNHHQDQSGCGTAASLSRQYPQRRARRGRDLSRERCWRRLLGVFAESGLSVRAFCEANDIRATSFYYWRRELRHRDAEGAGDTSIHSAHDASAYHSTRLAPAFVPVRVKEDAHFAASSPIEIVLVDGVRVHVRSGVDRSLLRDVLAALSFDAAHDEGGG